MKKLIFIIPLLAFLFSCEAKKTESEQTGKPVESMNAGDLTVYCEDIAYELMDSVFEMYDDAYEKVNLSTETVNSREAMKLLLAGDARVIVISRDYLKDEDSLMKSYEVDNHVRLDVAEDAIVLFTDPDFPLDTMNASLIKDILTGKKNSLKEHFRELSIEPEFVTLDYRTSVYANINEVINGGEPINRKLTTFADLDSLRDYVENTPNAIGISYLSHVVNQPQFKMLRMGFTDENGKRQFPQVVHQSYIVMGRYPWRVMHYAYLLEDRKNLPYWFATYLAKETVAQKYFMEFGIVPAYAQLKLVPQG